MVYEIDSKLGEDLLDTLFKVYAENIKENLNKLCKELLEDVELTKN